MTDRHLNWTNLLRLINTGAPARIGIPGSPVTELMIEPSGSALSLLVETPADVVAPLSALEAIRIDTTVIDSIHFLRLSTRIRPLFRDFYALLIEVADSIQLDGEPPIKAIHERLESWKELLRNISLLGAEQQLGLLGELWVLRRLICVRGAQALDSWTGPLAEPHDFRMSGTEIEVKATKNRRRLHIINGLEQLVPSSGQELHVLSLQFEPAATVDSFSLRQMVVDIRTRLQIDDIRRQTFELMLRDGSGYRNADEDHYTATFRLRTSPALVHVDDQCPRLTRELVRGMIGGQIEQRVVDVRYAVDLDGLGVPDGSPEFLAILPTAEKALSGSQ